jgi:hypothetical protein
MDGHRETGTHGYRETGTHGYRETEKQDLLLLVIADWENKKMPLAKDDGN